jgi:hypothetical protein
VSAQTAADLRAAAEVLERDGWTQGDFRNEYGCRCVSSAIAFVASECRTSQAGLLDLDGGEFDRWVAAARLFRETVRQDSIVRFNDEPGRTAAEVIAALRAAADAAEARS